MNLAAGSSRDDAWIERDGVRLSFSDALARAALTKDPGGYFELSGWLGRVHSSGVDFIAPRSHRSGHRHRGSRAWSRRHAHRA